MDKIQLKALAKINLGLDVLRRREDGYHEVKMIMQTIGLHDDLEIRKTKTPGIQVKTNLYYLPTNENNLVYKAAKLLMDEFQIQDGVSIQLKKRIPVAAGMAGGSSQAGSRCALLYSERNSTGRRDWGKTECAAAHAKMHDPYCEARHQRVHKICV